MAGIGIGDVGASGTSELRVELQRSPYISDDNEGRAPLGGWQSAQVLVGLIVSGKHSLVPPVAVQHLPGLLGFEDKTSTPVEVDIAAGDATVRFSHIDAAFKDVTVGGSIYTRRVRLGQAEQRAELRQKKLIIGPLATSRITPTRNEGICPVCGEGVGEYHLFWSQAKQHGIVSDRGAPVFRRVNPVALTGGESFPG